MQINVYYFPSLLPARFSNNFYFCFFVVIVVVIIVVIAICSIHIVDIVVATAATVRVYFSVIQEPTASFLLFLLLLLLLCSTHTHTYIHRNTHLVSLENEMSKKGQFGKNKE